MLAKISAVVIGIILFYAAAKTATQLLPPLKHWWALKQAATSLIKDPASVLTNFNGRTNVLILGKGGAGHEAPDLTDTIIVLSYHYQSDTTLLISLPRDLWIDSLQAKINTAYYYGNQKRLGGGLILAKAAVEEVIDQPIHYAAVVDFNSFTDLINLVGGVEVEVPVAFDDYKYPIPGKETALPEADRYEHLRFEAGTQVMDGERALKYVRSRNSEGEEGTDFARSKRQQQVILALQKKLMSTETLLQPKKLSALLSTVSKSIETNTPPEVIPALVKLAIQFNRDQLTIATLDQGDKQTGRKGLLINPEITKYKGQWVLTGKDGTWQEVQTYINTIFTHP